MDTHHTQRRRTKRRSYKALRTVVLLLACLSAPTGMGMSLWGYSEHNSLPFVFGMLNIATSVLCLLIWAFLRRRPSPTSAGAVQRLRPSAPPVTTSFANSPQAGMALLVSLLILALLSGMALQALVASGMDVRFARQRHTACLLRSAGTDAIWATLRTASTISPDTKARFDHTMTAGPGIQATTSLREVDRSALPPPLLYQNTPLFGRFYSITSRITHSADAREIRAVACLTPAGEMRLLSWTEPL